MIENRRMIGLRLWATVWSVIVSFVFIGVTGLTLVVWRMDPDQAETTPVSDLSFFALGAIIALGLISQVRSPEHNIAGIQQAIIAIVALGVAGVVGARVEPAVGSLILLLVVAVVVTFHPHRRAILPADLSIDARTLAVSALAAIPAFWYAASMLALATNAGPSCFLGRCAGGDRLAEMAATAVAVVLVGVLSALRTPGWRLSLWSAGGSGVLIGVSSLALDDVVGSLGHGWGFLAVVWGVLLITTGERGRRPQPNGERERPKSNAFA
jgi:hypothetical protein